MFTGDVRSYLTNLYLTNLSEIQNALVRTKSFQHLSYFEIQQHFSFNNQNLRQLFGKFQVT